jgi:hypothetical protein
MDAEPLLPPREGSIRIETHVLSRFSKKWRSPVHAREAALYPRRTDGVVRRVVLDTNVAWYEDVSALEALRGRGFLLSISLDAIAERWARAARMERPGLLARARAIDPVLDPRMRFGVSGAMLEDQLGCLGRDADEQQRYRFVHAAAEQRWQQLVRGLPDDWLEAGQAVDRVIEAQAQEWIAKLARVPEIIRQADALAGTNAEAGVPEDEAIVLLARRFAEDLHIGMPGGAVERLDAASRVFVRHVIAAGYHGRLPESNDYEDFRLLLHLAVPVFLVTNDTRLVKLVDETRSFQAPWVRTLAQMQARDLPTGVPWGSDARRQAREFRRAPCAG